jgi:hypothetical protein
LSFCREGGPGLCCKGSAVDGQRSRRRGWLSVRLCTRTADSYHSRRKLVCGFVRATSPVRGTRPTEPTPADARGFLYGNDHRAGLGAMRIIYALVPAGRYCLKTQNPRGCWSAGMVTMLSKVGPAPACMGLLAWGAVENTILLPTKAYSYHVDTWRMCREATVASETFTCCVAGRG